MADPTTPTPSPSPDRESAIEQLLLTGLDHYFAGRFDQAIHLWTRILFLDRGHVRARAYIERARLAVAEGQRALEERQSRDGGVTAATSRPHAALPALPPFEPPGDPLGAAAAGATDAPARMDRRAPAESVWPHVSLTVVSLVLLCAAAFIASEGETVSRWMLASPSELSAVEPMDDRGTLPVPDTSRMLVERARALFARGHVRDALGVLDGIRPNDVAKPESDALRGELQRALLDAGGFPATVANAPPTTR